ncbi:MAG: hypothetical protein H3C53_02540, partial [Trueperaceae bacterium]|nr:hypothetical protein [Trueperaceae bacterium]
MTDRNSGAGRQVRELGLRMCGIAGCYKAADRVSEQLLLEMAGELAHRGPNGVGLYLDGRFGMVNTRLAIIDLAGGDQPISDEG